MELRPTQGATPGGDIQVRAVQLREGATVVARVVSAGGEGRDGVLALAGVVVRARLPRGVRAGQKLALVVAGVEGEKIVLRRARAAGRKAAATVPGRLVAALATRGDGELLRVALALSGGVVQLPGGRTAAIGQDEEDETVRMDDEEGVVSLVLHAPGLGPLEARVRLVGGRVEVAVTAEPGEASEIARREAAALAARIGAAAGTAATVVVAQRRGAAPAPPVVDAEPFEELERYA
jgi:hypothetical protein